MANEPVITHAQLTEMAGRALSEALEDRAALPGDVVLLVGEVKRLQAAIRSRDMHITAIGQTSSQWKAEREQMLARIRELEQRAMASVDKT